MPAKGVADFVEFVLFIRTDKSHLSLHITEVFYHCLCDYFYLQEVMLLGKPKHFGILLKLCCFCVVSIYSFSNNKVNGNAKPEK